MGLLYAGYEGEGVRGGQGTGNSVARWGQRALTVWALKSKSLNRQGENYGTVEL